MKKAARHFNIKQELNKKGQVTVLQLAKMFNVTSETIRRDLTILENEKLLQKIHGGAISLSNYVEDSLDERFETNIDAKQDIAEKTLQLIQPYCRLFIDFGSTTLAVATQLHKINDLTIYTNSPLLAQTVKSGGNLSHKVFILGGEYHDKLRENLGYMTLNTIRQYAADVAIVGCAAIDEYMGFMDINPDEGEIAKLMFQNANSKIIVADQSKFFKKSGMQIASFRDVDFLVSSKEDKKMQEICEKHHVTFL